MVETHKRKLDTTLKKSCSFSATAENRLLLPPSGHDMQRHHKMNLDGVIKHRQTSHHKGSIHYKLNLNANYISDHPQNTVYFDLSYMNSGYIQIYYPKKNKIYLSCNQKKFPENKIFQI